MFNYTYNNSHFSVNVVELIMFMWFRKLWKWIYGEKKAIKDKKPVITKLDGYNLLSINPLNRLQTGHIIYEDIPAYLERQKELAKEAADAGKTDFAAVTGCDERWLPARSADSIRKRKEFNERVTWAKGKVKKADPASTRKVASEMRLYMAHPEHPVILSKWYRRIGKKYIQKMTLDQAKALAKNSGNYSIFRYV